MAEPSRAVGREAFAGAAPEGGGGPLLALEDVGVAIGGEPILEGIRLEAHAGRTLGIVGESGSGKSMTALAAMRLLPRGAALSGSIRFDGRDLARLDERALQRVRGAEIGMVFQEPMTALNPLHPIGRQVEESLRLHRGVGADEARRLARETLERVELPPRRYSPRRYPHELSGGQRQRVAIAIAIACRPRLLIADEPTTALDVTTQAEVLALLKTLREEDGLALVLISHDLAVVGEVADEIVVMRRGRVVDRGAFAEVFSARGNPYSRSLADATAWTRPARLVTHAPSAPPLLEVRGLVCSYPGARRSWLGARGRTVAVDGVDLEVRAGENVGLVGESGCGKSTLVRALLGLGPVDAGSIRLGGTELAASGARRATLSRAARRRIQVVFQDPYGSFDPRHRVERLVAEPLHLLDARPSRAERRRRVARMLERVGLEPGHMRRWIHEFSGGQRQRIAIARALVVEPELVVLDEAVSALDVSVRAQVLALLDDLSADAGLAYLFISHDLSVVRRVTDRCSVMRAGRIVERGPTAEVFDAPSHAYTRSLVAAIPRLPNPPAGPGSMGEASADPGPESGHYWPDSGPG